MNEEMMQEPIHIVLSRDELLALLHILQAESIPGIDVEPLGARSDAQQNLAFTIAQRALRARGLARMQDDELHIHQTLLSAVAVCAYAQQTIFAYHWPQNADAPIRYFGHIRGEEVVAHTRPEDILHRFSVLASKAQLVEQALAFCQVEEMSASYSVKFTTSNSCFVQVREAAIAGNKDEAIRLLVNDGIGSQHATAFVETWVDVPQISIFQTLRPQEGGQESLTVQKRDFTVLQGTQARWFIHPLSEREDESILSIKTVHRDEIATILSDSL